jgi:hypothetical protein
MIPHLSTRLRSLALLASRFACAPGESGEPVSPTIEEQRMFRTTIVSNVENCRTEAEISDGSENVVAVVYEDESGWHVHPAAGELPAPDILNQAQQCLERYINRRGHNRPEGLSRCALALWLMQRANGLVA